MLKILAMANCGSLQRNMETITFLRPQKLKQHSGITQQFLCACNQCARLKFRSRSFLKGSVDYRLQALRRTVAVLLSNSRTQSTFLWSHHSVLEGWLHMVQMRSRVGLTCICIWCGVTSATAMVALPPAILYYSRLAFAGTKTSSRKLFQANYRFSVIRRCVSHKWISYGTIKMAFPGMHIRLRW